MVSKSVSFIAPQNALNGLTPCEGPKALNYIMDFTAAAEYDFDLSQQWQQGAFTTVQCAYIDNGLNTSPCFITVNGTGQTITVPPNTCGFYTLLMVDPPKLSIASAGQFQIYVALLNFYVPPTVWKVA